ncbi:hypothetical protein QF030_001160 [Streptomyces rishiriensis]|uniref:Beta-lactamase-related domain-containing protein n=1 Tax=Streptomyces rishiriensis TaxID=68264 RepID=A0ABU0NK64_STRRH|nr:hypothetical protein [Streptomyces rishiriensis]
MDSPDGVRDGASSRGSGGDVAIRVLELEEAPPHATHPSRRLFAAAMLAASVPAPMTAVPATAVPAAGVVRYDGDECPPDGLGPEPTARLDRAIKDVRRTAGIPGVIAGLWMPGKGSYVRATGVADTATGRPTTTDKFQRIGSETKTRTAGRDSRKRRDACHSAAARHWPDDTVVTAAALCGRLRLVGHPRRS